MYTCCHGCQKICEICKSLSSHLLSADGTINSLTFVLTLKWHLCYKIFWLVCFVLTLQIGLHWNSSLNGPRLPEKEGLSCLVTSLECDWQLSRQSRQTKAKSVPQWKTDWKLNKCKMFTTFDLKIAQINNMLYNMLQFAMGSSFIFPDDQHKANLLLSEFPARCVKMVAVF